MRESETGKEILGGEVVDANPTPFKLICIQYLWTYVKISQSMVFLEAVVKILA